MKIYISGVAKGRIAHEVLTFNGASFTDEAHYLGELEKVLAEINDGDGRFHADGQLPQFMQLNLKCGLTFIVPNWDFVIDRRSVAGIIGA